MSPNGIDIFNNGTVVIYPYGICIAVGLILCLVTFYILSNKGKVPEKVQDFVFFVFIAAVAIGFVVAMLFQAFYNWLDGKEFELGSGMTVMGGLIGGAGAFLIIYFLVGKLYFRGKSKDIHKKHFNTILRLAPICICIAHACGRIGCLMSGCCHGTYLGQEPVFGGIYMYGSVNGFKQWGYYIPTQLYEALFLFALTAVLAVLFFKRSNITMQIYLIAYGVWRIFIEIFRADYRGEVVLGLYPSQWQSIFFILGGIAMLFIYYKMKKTFVLPKDKEQTQDQIENKE